MWFSKIQAITDGAVAAELPALLEALPPWRRENALSYRFDKDRYACAKAYLLLKELLLDHYGIGEDVEFSFGQYGKPFLKKYPEIHFNFSHCPKAVFCAVGDTALGVDVEDIQYDEDLAHTVFNGLEFQTIQDAEKPSEKFTEYWTKKESYLKLTGSGLADDLKLVFNNMPRPVDFKTDIYPDIGVVTTVAAFK